MGAATSIRRLRRLFEWKFAGAIVRSNIVGRWDRLSQLKLLYTAVPLDSMLDNEPNKAHLDMYISLLLAGLVA